MKTRAQMLVSQNRALARSLHETREILAANILNMKVGLSRNVWVEEAWANLYYEALNYAKGLRDA